MIRTETEKRTAFNRTGVHLPFVAVHERIRQRAGKHPDRTAVICSGRKTSFGELDERSDRVAAELIRRGYGANDLIAVLLERETAAYAAEIGVLKAGAGFMPLIPDYPRERVEYCMRDSGSRLLLTTEKLRDSRHFPAEGYEVLALEEIPECAETVSFPRVSERDLAYCIYTSGTTGKPRGVLIEHGNIASFVSRNLEFTGALRFAEPGRISLALAPFSFDFSLEEELLPLCCGNTVVIATEEEVHDPLKFAEMVLRTGADTMACTPTYLSGLLAVHESREALRNISVYNIGGEAFPKRLFSMLREVREDSDVINVYGPTECTIITSSARVTGDGEITVGRPCAGTRYSIQDPSGRELPTGQKGELIICGRQVGRGYVGKEASGDLFFTWQGMPAYRSGDLASRTEKGEILIHGRKDSQVKLRGYRIDLTEIEAVMSEFPGVRAAAAALKEKEGIRYLAGYYTAAEGTVDRALMKRHMRLKLPDYMIPNVFMRLERMPVSTHGKLKREDLPEPEGAEVRSGYIPPERAEEKKLCAAFEKVLHREAHSVGLSDDFFDLSGDSVSAMELLAEAGIEGLTYADIFAFRTPAEILGEVRRRGTGQSLTDTDRAVPLPLTPVQRELMEVQRMVPRGATVSSMRFLMRLGEKVDRERFRDALNRVLAHHPGFAMRFFRDAEGEIRQRYDPRLIPLSEIREICPEEEARLAGEVIRPFEQMEDHSLCRVSLFHGEGGTYFFMDVHHLLADGLSIPVFFRNLKAAYRGGEIRKDPYLALLAMEEESTGHGRYEADRAYLLRRYGGYDWCIMPFEEDPGCGERGASLCRTLRFDAAQAGKAAERLSVSFSVMHIAAILLAMHRFTGRKDVMAFWTFHNRRFRGAEDSVGMFIQTLPVGCHMDGISSLEELLASVKEQVVSGIAHSAFSYVVEEVFSRRIPWIESNIQMNPETPDLTWLAPEEIPMVNAYPDTADNVMLAVITREQERLDISFTRAGPGMRVRDVEAMHEMIAGILEAMVLDENVDLQGVIPGSAGC